MDELERTPLGNQQFAQKVVDWQATKAIYIPGLGEPEPSVLSNRRDILLEAAELVDGDRNAQYGDPNQDFARTAAFWNTYLAGVEERTGARIIEPHDVAWMMTLLKCSRSTVSPLKRDHYADAAGYVACGWDCACHAES